jgi:hypothetical protein
MGSSRLWIVARRILHELRVQRRAEKPSYAEDGLARVSHGHGLSNSLVDE